eukprot:m.334105 g.334105  ORF g.334105 m.334105 type:complete len:489 (-) comp17290_c0_seq1:120-1586(-)
MAAHFKHSLTSTQAENLKRDLDALTDTVEEKHRPAQRESMVQFTQILRQYLKEKGSKVEWPLIKQPPEGMIKKHADLPEPTKEQLTAIMDKLAVLKLNGGLGTSMGCKGPKSVIEVRNDMSFLDLAVMQIEHLNETYGCSVPLILMNSFNTDEDTAAVLRKYANLKVNFMPFNQSMMPRLHYDSNVPAAKSVDDKDGWYPPGHGDLYRSLKRSGMLKKLLDMGKEYLFVSNIDNLGSVVDNRILLELAQAEDREFIMEVTDKTRADVKGGTLIEYQGQCRLLEIAQVDSEHLQEFKSISKFKIFNTNNLWMKLSAIDRILGEDKMHMEVIENVKSVNGSKVIQLEQAVGTAIKNFKGGIGINVPRSRFLPVKQCQDLLLVMSDLFHQQNGALRLNPARELSHTGQVLPLIKLGSEFKKVADFLSRFDSIPEILELDHLTVSGNVRFGRGVTLKGTVIIIANKGERIDIPARSLLENKIITGNLHVLEH